MKKELYCIPEAVLLELQIGSAILAESSQVKGDNIDQWVEGESNWF